MGELPMKNPWVLTGILYIITFLAGIFIYGVVTFFNLGLTSIAGLAGVIGGMVTGHIYAARFKQAMERKLRMNVAIIYTAVQLVFAAFLGLFLNFKDLMVFLGIVLLFCIIYGFLIYWSLGTGSRSYSKVLNKSAARKIKGQDDKSY